MTYNTRNGPFFSTLFVFIAVALANKELPRKNFAVALLAGGFALHLIEAILLREFYGSPISSHNALLGTVAFGTGAFLLAMRYPEFGKSTVWPRVGRLVLGVYAFHVLVTMPMMKMCVYLPGASEAWRLGHRRYRLCLRCLGELYLSF